MLYIEKYRIWMAGELKKGNSIEHLVFIGKVEGIKCMELQWTWGLVAFERS